MRSALKRFHQLCRLYGHDMRLQLNGSYRQKPSVSFCTPVKNRLQHLKKTVLKNLKDNEHYPFLEIVILNYACPDPETELWVKQELAEFIKTGRVSYYHYPDTETFDYSHAKNLSHGLANGDILCNVDADNYTGVGFAHFCAAQLNDRSSFLAGPRDGRGLGGRIALRREHFEQCGGYDERIVDWGGCDYELTLRLERLALIKRSIYKEKYLHAIKHSDELRTHYSQFDDKWRTHGLIAQLIDQNKIDRVLNPNGQNFGRGRVQRNFGEWITL